MLSFYSWFAYLTGGGLHGLLEANLAGSSSFFEN
jgi:hypothetical protein